MSERHNVVHGTVSGALVQAGAIHGDVHVRHTATPRFTGVSPLSPVVRTFTDRIAPMAQAAGYIDGAAPDGVSLTTILDTEYARLDDTAARVYRVAGLHPTPGFDVWAIAATGIEVGEARAALEQLRAAGLLEQDDAHRFTMHPVLREHAATLAAEHGTPEERKAVVRCFADYYLVAAVAADELLSDRKPIGPHYGRRPTLAVPDFAAAQRGETDEPAPLDWFAENIRAIVTLAARHLGPVRGPAGEIGEKGFCWQLAIAADGFFRRAGHYADRFTLAELGLQDAIACEESAAEARVRIQWGIGCLEVEQWDEAFGHCNLALSLSEQDRDGYGQGAALECMGIVSLNRERFAEASFFLERSRPFMEREDRPRTITLNHLHQGRTRTGLGDHALALDFLDRAWQGFQEQRAQGRPEPFNEAKVLLARCDALLVAGRREEASTEAEQALDLFKAADARYWRGQAFEAMARAATTGEARAKALRSALEVYEGVRNEKAAKRVTDLLAEKG